MTLDDENAANTARETDAFTAGFEGKQTEQPGTDETDTAAEKPRDEVKTEPEYAQITKEELTVLRAAAAKTASYDQQFSKAFGSLGGLQRTITALQAQTPRGGKVEIPKDAFAAMEKDFPELAEQTKSALTAALAGMTGTGQSAPNSAEIERLFGEHASKRETEIRLREIESLEDAYPDWKQIVGAVEDAAKTPPDANHPFRKWLSAQPQAYQDRLNNTVSSRVIERAIERFKAETKTVTAPSKTAVAARQAQLKAAIQPRGDGGAPASTNPREDAFLAGFRQT